MSSLGPGKQRVGSHLQVIPSGLYVQHGNTPGHFTSLACAHQVEKLRTCPLQKKLHLAAAVMKLLPGASWSCPIAVLAVKLGHQPHTFPWERRYAHLCLCLPRTTVSWCRCCVTIRKEGASAVPTTQQQNPTYQLQPVPGCLPFPTGKLCTSCSSVSKAVHCAISSLHH